MKKIIVLSIVVFFTVAGYCQQEKQPSAFEVVERVGARIQQIPDGESIKTVSGMIKIELKLNDSDFATLKNLSEKLISSSVIKKTVNHYLELIAFNQGNKFPTLSRGQKINLVYTLEVNRWGGVEKVRGRIETILL